MQKQATKYALQPIASTAHTRMLPEGTALVLEGGGTRGFYSAGVFEAFMDEGWMFPYIIGVSAGAANACSYIAGQKGRNRQIAEHYVSDPRYLSKRNLLRHRSLFGYDFIFGEIPTRHVFWDTEAFQHCEGRFLTGATDCETGAPLWFEKDAYKGGFDVLKASCSMPVVSPIVRYAGHALLDGGTSAPIPIEKSIADGNTRHVIVLTRNAGYVKSPFRHQKALKTLYSKYPKLIETIMARHDIYKRQLALCEQLEREGKAVIIRPLEPLSVDTSANDTAKLLALYDEGHAEGRQALTRIEALVR